jgi:hypothetical protein
MKKILRALLPGFIIDWRNRIYNERKHARFKVMPIQDVFTEIHKTNHWKDGQSVSGTGSNQSQTEELKRILVKITEQFQIRSIIDAPCGDFNWMKDVNLNDIQYHGIDIVPQVIESNSLQYANERRSFSLGDITTTTLPMVDLIFCRDCLVHFSFEDVHRALKNFKASGSKYLLTTTFPQHNNYNIVTGNWRPIDLTKKPFKFPAPLAIYNEHCTEDMRYADKSLGLWKIEVIEV